MTDVTQPQFKLEAIWYGLVYIDMNETVSKMVCQLKESDVEKAARVLGKSFMNYPAFEYIFPDSEYRQKKISYAFLFLVRLAINNGFVFVPSEKIEGVAVLVNSSNSQSQIFDVLRSGLLSLFYKTGFNSFFRFLQIGNKNSKVRSEILHGETYYILDAIGVEPKYQSRGFARMLLSLCLNISEEEGVPIYLQTSKASNISFYKQFGFNQIHSYKTDNYSAYCLYRSPKSANPFLHRAPVKNPPGLV